MTAYAANHVVKVQPFLRHERACHNDPTFSFVFELNESYLLLQKIASENAIDSIVVAATRLELVTPGL